VTVIVYVTLVPAATGFGAALIVTARFAVFTDGAASALDRRVPSNRGASRNGEWAGVAADVLRRGAPASPMSAGSARTVSASSATLRARMERVIRWRGRTFERTGL
jgi:hypothetical protein